LDTILNMHSRIPYQAEGRSMARQAGGTVAGLIIGLIIGLTIAVWVAITIMKTPLPFVDKLGKQNDAADTAIDPNATLPGGARDRRVIPNAEEGAPLGEQKAAPTSTPTTAAPPNTAAKAPVTPATTAATENAKTDKAATTTASDEKNIYFLQAGAFREIADADAAKGRLALLGVAAAVSERRTETGTLYRVRVGPFKDTDSLHKMRTRLYDNGVDAAVVSVPK
jgi:cell division protein FtsN